MSVDRIVDTVSTDNKCNYKSLREDSIQFAAINEEFNNITGVNNATFKLNIDAMFTPDCKNQINRLNFI